MNTLVSEEQVARYRSDGVVLIRNLFDAKWLEVLAEGVEENLRNPSKRTTDYVNDPQKKEHFSSMPAPWGRLVATTVS